MTTAIAVVLALCAAFCFALGSLIQQSAARQTHGRALRLGLLVTLLREERWLGGLALTVFSFGVQAAALAFGPLALVQPLATIDVLFALPLIARLNRRPRGRKAILGGLLDALTKGTVDMLPARGAGVLATWEPYALLVTGVLGTLFGQSAFHAGPLSVSLPVVDTVEPATAVVLAAVVFRESLARSPWLLALQLAGAAVAVAGIALLSHSCAAVAEEQRESGLAGAAAERAR